MVLLCSKKNTDTNEQSNALNPEIKMEGTEMEANDSSIGNEDIHLRKRKRRKYGISVCKICCKIFENRADFQRHLFLHVNEMPYSCTICNLRFTRKYHIRQHLKIKHHILAMDHIKVKYKIQNNDRREEIDPSLKVGYSRALLQCKYCQKVLLKKNYSRHLRTHDQLRIYICSICSYRCVDDSKFLEHMQVFHKGIFTSNRIEEMFPFSCETCNQSFAYKMRFEMHKCVPIENKKYKCSHCVYKTKTKSSMKSHMKEVHDIDANLDEILEDLTVDLDEIKREGIIVTNLDIKSDNCDKSCHSDVNYESTGQIKPDMEIDEPMVCAVDNNLDIVGDDTKINKSNTKARFTIQESEDPIHISDESIEQIETCTLKSAENIGATNEIINSDKLCLGKISNGSIEEVKPDVEIHESKVVPVSLISKIPEVTMKVYSNYKEEIRYKAVIQKGARSYQCNICEKTLRKKYLMERHVLRHTGELPLSCLSCSFKARTKESMHLHLKEEHPFMVTNVQIGEKGENTGSIANSGEETRFRIVLDGEVRVYQCNFCDRTTKEKYLVERHILTHTGEFPLSCSLCSIKTRQKKSMRLHLKKEHNLIVNFKQIAKDGKLLMNTESKNENEYRIINNKGTKSYQCNSCNKQFQKKESFDKHFSLHSGVYSYFCTMCKHKSNERRNIQRHMLQVHKVKVDTGDIQKRESTDQLDDSSLTNAGGEEEISIKNIEKNCSTDKEIRPNLVETQDSTGPIAKNGSLVRSLENCDSSLPQVDNRCLVITKDDIRVYKCKTCGEILPEKCLFNAHYLTHISKLPYSCMVCGHKAKSKKTIKNHMRRRHKMNILTKDIPEEVSDSDNEEGEREDNNRDSEIECRYIETEEEDNKQFYKCLLCDKKLRTIHRMNLHFLVHKGKYLYTCTMCKFKTVDKYSMKNHLKARHNVKVSLADILKDGEVKQEAPVDVDSGTHI